MADVVVAVAEATAPAAPSVEAERAELLATLDSEFEAEEAEEAKPAGKPPKGAKVDEAEGDEEATEDKEGDADEENNDEEEESASEFASVDDFKEHAKSLLEEDGGPRKLEELLGLEKGTLKVNGSRIRFVKEQTRKAEEALAAANGDKSYADGILTEARAKYGTYAQSNVAFRSGTPQGILAAARAVEGHFGVPMAQFVDMVVKAGRGEASQALPQQQQSNSEIAELKANQERLLNLITEERAQRGAEAKKASDITRIAGHLKGTDLAKLKDGGARVYDAIVKSYDPVTKGYKLNLKSAIKAVLDDKATKYDLLQLRNRKVSAAPGEVTPAPPGGPKRVRVVAPAKHLTEAQKEEQERLSLIAELEAEERKAERLSKRSNGRR